MAGRIHCASHMLTVYRHGPTRGGDGWPGTPPVTEVRWGDNWDFIVLLEIVGDDAVRDLIAKLQAVLDKEGTGG